MSALRRRWWLVLLALLALVALFGTRVATFVTDVLWYRSVGFMDVYGTVLATRIGLGVLVGGLVTVLVGGNLLLARRLAPTFRMPTPPEEGIERYRDAIEPVARPLLLVVAGLVGLLTGLSASANWSDYLLWANATEFGRPDPVFGLDLGFFVFRLPFYELVNSLAFTALALTILLTAAASYLFGGIRPQVPSRRVTPQANVHLSVLLAALVAVRAWGFWLDRYLLSYSTRGVVSGLSYTDANAQLPAYQLLTVIAAVCVLLFLANIRFRNFLLPATGVGILVVAAVVLSGVFPAVFQRLRVAPQELLREEPYIADSLEFTRFGYGIELDENVEVRDFAASEEIAAEDLERSQDTLESIRLWDPNVVGTVYTQLQGLRRYFEFPDVDVDRYFIDGRTQQVNLAVRELDESDLPQANWQNRRLRFTHGFGLVASSVSGKTASGEPEFLVSDIPPQGAVVLEVDQPRVYFGERQPLYSVVRTGVEELDFVNNEQETGFTYDGADGIGVGSLGMRLAFALREREPNFLLSSLLTPESRVLLYRSVEQRVESVAPFLQLDSDPYAVAADGGIKWVLDAYTVSDMLPYSQRVELGELTESEQIVLLQQPGADGQLQLVSARQNVPGLQGRANYIRNSVKAVVDAYDGSVTLYAVDTEDPVLQAWRNVFPDAFTDASEASQTLQEHFRYPEDLFRVQSAVFATYHVDSPSLYFSGEDAWTIPRDAAQIENLRNENSPPAEEGQGPPLRPYYLQLRLPEEDEEEFALIQPFNPAGRNNLIAWVAARSDPGVYGQLKAYLMPADENVLGTSQIQAQINQDEELATQITLLSQQGSQLIYGNLLVVPIADALLYAQPLYVSAQQGSIPELRFVVLVFNGQVVAEPTLAESLAVLFGGDAPVAIPSDADVETPAPSEEDDDVAGLLAQAVSAFEDAEAALAEGDLGAYQEATRRAGDLLRRAQEAAGGPSVAPSPRASPTGAGTPAADDDTANG